MVRITNSDFIVETDEYGMTTVTHPSSNDRFEASVDELAEIAQAAREDFE